MNGLTAKRIMNPDLTDGYEAGAYVDKACLIPVQTFLADPIQRRKLEDRLSATSDRAGQERLMGLLDEIAVTLYAGEVLDPRTWTR